MDIAFAGCSAVDFNAVEVVIILKNLYFSQIDFPNCAQAQLANQ